MSETYVLCHTNQRAESGDTHTHTPHCTRVRCSSALDRLALGSGVCLCASVLHTKRGGAAGLRMLPSASRAPRLPLAWPLAALPPAAISCNLMQPLGASQQGTAYEHSPRAQPTSTAHEHSPRGGPGPQPQPPPRSRRATPPRSTPTTYTYHLHTYHLHTYHLQVHVRVVRVCVGASVAPSRPS